MMRAVVAQFSEVMKAGFGSFREHLLISKDFLVIEKHLHFFDCKQWQSILGEVNSKPRRSKWLSAAYQGVIFAWCQTTDVGSVCLSGGREEQKADTSYAQLRAPPGLPPTQAFSEHLPSYHCALDKDNFV